MFNPNNIPQSQDFLYGGIYIGKDKYKQGGTNVYNVIEHWLEIIHLSNYLLIT
jgi:hypothetical protein